MAKITKQQFDKLFDENISKKEYDHIIDLINERFSEICLKIIPKPRDRGFWFDYGNCNYDTENSNGYFDPKEYKKEIQVGGMFSGLTHPYNEWSGETDGYMENSFPTRWLWEEFEGEFADRVKKAKQSIIQEKELAKQKLEKKKLKKIEFKKIIMSKLTKEELKYIKFK